MRNLITGGAGFLGSHLVDKLLKSNEEVICLDNYLTGSKKNIIKWKHHPNFKAIKHDVINPINLRIDRIWHLACSASPVHYQSDPINTAKTSFIGTLNMLELAKKFNARILLASTSEIYGNPEIHPQIEEYRGCVSTTGIRSCYVEGKRISETLCFDYKRMHNVQIRIARIFNTYGPRMLQNDGRVISNFISRALKGNLITIYGDGKQTRSFCYVDDLINGLIKLMNSNFEMPINIGNPNELSILELYEIIKEKINPNLDVEFRKLPQDDPLKRKPNIEKAKLYLDWQPKTSLEKGLEITIESFKKL